MPEDCHHFHTVVLTEVRRGTGGRVQGLASPLVGHGHKRPLPLQIALLTLHGGACDPADRLVSGLCGHPTPRNRIPFHPQAHVL